MKVGRNDPCPCNSGKKYKKCCFGTEVDPRFIGKNSLEASQIRKDKLPRNEKLSQRLINIANRIAYEGGISSAEVDFDALAMTWNMAVVERLDPGSADSFIRTIDSLNEIEAIKYGMSLKEEMYPEDLRFIHDYQVRISNGRVNVNVASLKAEEYKKAKKSGTLRTPYNPRANDSNVIQIH